MESIRGAGEWGDMPHNVITVWRNMEKAEHMAESKNLNLDKDDIDEYDKTVPSGKILVRKQRTTGKTPMTRFWFDELTNRFTPNYGPALPMYSERPW
jgi:hypothetical protein